jgi:hypothetical protein
MLGILVLEQSGAQKGGRILFCLNAVKNDPHWAADNEDYEQETYINMP